MIKNKEPKGKKKALVKVVYEYKIDDFLPIKNSIVFCQSYFFFFVNLSKNEHKQKQKASLPVNALLLFLILYF